MSQNLLKLLRNKRLGERDGSAESNVVPVKKSVLSDVPYT